MSSLAVGPSLAHAAGAAAWDWPLAPRPPIVSAFDASAEPYAAGNRGVDLAGAVGQTVFAVADGVVSFAGPLAGRGVVVVDHGRVRSTYEPVTAGVEVGDPVRSGQPIGVLALVGSHCVPQACLHLGAIRGSEYVDPLSFLGSAPIRLKPLTDEQAAPARPPSAIADAVVAVAGYPWPAVR